MKTIFNENENDVCLTAPVPKNGEKKEKKITIFCCCGC